jgi:hypothetical protein
LANRSTFSQHLIASAALALVSVGSATCAIEGSDACGANQVFKKGGNALKYAVCVCDEANGWVFDEQEGYGCKRCSAGQTIVGSKCVAMPVDAGADEPDASGPREPTGVGASCNSDADCAAYDAKYCAVQTHSCLINRCATKENVCQTMATCCDYGALLAGLSLCLPNEQLNDGKCPMGGTRVDP